MSIRYLIMLLITISLPSLGWSEVVHFKNGDRITGSFVRFVDGTAVFKADVLGTVNLSLDKIKTFTTEKPVVVMLKSGQTERGHLTLTQTGEWTLESGGTVSPVEKKMVAAVYPIEVYSPANPEKPHRPWQDWKANGNFGYNLQHSSGHSGALTLALTPSGLSRRCRACRHNGVRTIRSAWHS